MAGLVGDCLSPEAVQGFVSGALAADASDRIEAHLDGCQDCRALIAAVARADTLRSPVPGRAPVSGLEETAPISSPSAAPISSPPVSSVDSPESAPTGVDLEAPRRQAASTGHPPPGDFRERFCEGFPRGESQA